MREYEFILKFKLAASDDDPDQFVEALEKAGCDDALIGIGQKGYIALDFTREADSADDAVYGAILQVKDAISGALLVEASPDYVGVSDAADWLKLTRQYMRKLIQTNVEGFPTPMHMGSSSIYHLAEILTWISANKSREIECQLVDVAMLNMRLNMCNQYGVVIQCVDQGAKAKSSSDVREEYVKHCLDSQVPKEVIEVLKSSPQLMSKQS